MRHQPTAAEDSLWQALRRDQVGGLRFRRQHAIGNYIVDFYCVRAGLVVEVDGPVHDLMRAEDEERQSNLEAMGLRVLRFSNAQVMNNLPDVLKQIEKLASAPSPRKERGQGER